MATLDPDAQAVLDVIAASGAPSLAAMGVQTARERVRASLISRRPPTPVASVEDRTITTPDGPLGVRIYRPAEGRLPAVVFVHGGGWTLNDLDTHDELCRKLAAQSGCVLVSVDFRRAPEHRHPAALQDAEHAYQWVRENAAELDCDPDRVALAGESSGANTAAALALQLRDTGQPMPVLQVLLYPATDSPGRWPSYDERGHGYILDQELMHWYFAQYVPDGADLDDPYLFPVRAGDLSGLPRAFVLTAEFDPLRDEGVAYVRRLREAGVSAEHIHAEDQMHGFLLLGTVVPRVEQYVRRVAAALATLRASA